MTNPQGKSFLSYKRDRADEARRLIAAQRRHGIPTWQDVEDLLECPTEDELRRVLASPGIANAVLWITPEVANSAIIRETEAPAIVRRARATNDPFFAVPVAAGGLDWDGAATAISSAASLENLKQWNMQRAHSDPATEKDAVMVAKNVLRRRLRALHSALPTDRPLGLSIFTRTPAPTDDPDCLVVDWSQDFEGREAKAGTWRADLLPALGRTVESIRSFAPGRTVAAKGLCALPAALALGRAFLEPVGVAIGWDQRGQSWSLAAPREESGFVAEVSAHDAEGDHVIALVCVNADVEPAVKRILPGLPRIRAIVKVAKPGAATHRIESAGQAADVAHMVIEAIRSVRDRYSGMKRTHLFLAVPAGLAMMIGQLLNTLGPVQTYEHIQTDAVGIYRKAALLSDAVT